MQFFYNANLFGSCIIHILYTGCAKIKKKKFRRQRVNSIDFIYGSLNYFWLASNDKELSQGCLEI